MIKLSAETQGLMNKLQNLSTHGVMNAVSTAMTWTARDAAEAFAKVIAEKVDQPTPFTQKASRYKPATADRTAYDVYVQDEASKGNPPSKYLKALVQGGYRRNKGTEAALRYKGILPPGFQVQPGDDAPLDKYGNLQGGGGKYVQIISALQAFRETGYQSNRTAGSVAKRGGALKEFFVLYSRETKTPTGVYTRTGRGGKGIAQILKFTPKRAKYNAVLPFRATIARVWNDNFENNFRLALKRMISKKGGTW